LQSARYLQSRLAPLTAALTKQSPAALKYALNLLGYMSADTRLPIVELDDASKAEVASAIAGIGDEDLACAAESTDDEPRSHEGSAPGAQAYPG
jgi:4-hydroxy-tetrahydrodipicolinate synthase